MKSYTAIVLVAIFSALIVSCESYGQVYCGRRLATALSILCDNNLLVKRTLVRDKPDDFYWPWIASHKANQFGRGKRQVVSECCDKPCTEDELLSYC